LQPRLIHPLGMIPQRPLQHRAAVIHLAHHHVAGNQAGGAFVLRDAVLLHPQQHIALDFPKGGGQKAPPGREETQPNIALGAGAHQLGAGPRVVEAGDVLQRVQGKTRGLLPLPLDHHIFAVQAQIAVLAQDIQRVQQAFQGGFTSSMARRT